MEKLNYTQQELEMLALATLHNLPLKKTPKGKDAINLTKLAKYKIIPSYNDIITANKSKNFFEELDLLLYDKACEKGYEVDELTDEQRKNVKALTKDERADKNKKHNRKCNPIKLELKSIIENCFNNHDTPIIEFERQGESKYKIKFQDNFFTLELKKTRLTKEQQIAEMENFLQI